MTAGAVAVPTIIPLRAPIPGQHKTCIDSITKIELRSETPGATIYFTTNGAKPSPFQKIGPAAESTYRYKEPFRLPAGKKTLKVLAVSECGMRESHVITRTFDVEQAEGVPPDAGMDDLAFMGNVHPNVDTAKRDVRKFINKTVTSKEAWREVQSMKANDDLMREMTLHGGTSNRHRPGTGTRHLNNRMGSDKGQTNGYPDPDPHRNRRTTPSPRRMPPDSATQALRLQRETDFLKCVYCYADRPADPYARFCNECGNPVPPLPQNRMPPPEEGQMGTCVSCKSCVPFNTGSCLVCEAPIGPQNVPQASIKLADKVMCMTCGTANPANMLACVTCEARLTSAKPIYAGTSAPPMPKEDGRLLTCTKCGRVNNPDARFCDWCGAKPAPPTSALVCSKCTSSNHPYAKHCASCGTMLDAPVRADVRNSGISVAPSGKGGQAQWMPVTMPTVPVAKNDIATQTVGLFYPSNKEMEKKNKDDEEKLELERQMRDRKPLMTAISPGRGYWRKQMEHVASHLKSYASNNTEFRALIGEPRMGKLISATVHEDGYELSLTANFALRGNKDPFVGKEMGVSKEFLSSYTTGRKSSLNRYGSQDSLASGQSTSRSKKKSARKAKKKAPKQTNQSEENKRLLKELGKNGEGSASEVLQLIEEGGEVNLVNKDDIPLIIIATRNKHADAIPILVQEGADIDVKAPETGNTPLHEAVLLGNAGMETIDTIMNCGANTQKKNNKGDTAYDLAVKEGYDSVANKLASSLGQSGLDRMLSKKSTKLSDAFAD